MLLSVMMEETSQQKELAVSMENYSHKAQPRNVNSAGEVIIVQVAGREIPVSGVKENKDRKSLLIYYRTGSDG